MKASFIQMLASGSFSTATQRRMPVTVKYRHHPLTTSISPFTTRRVDHAVFLDCLTGCLLITLSAVRAPLES